MDMIIKDFDEEKHIESSLYARSSEKNCLQNKSPIHADKIVEAVKASKLKHFEVYYQDKLVYKSTDITGSYYPALTRIYYEHCKRNYVSLKNSIITPTVRHYFRITSHTTIRPKVAEGFGDEERLVYDSNLPYKKKEPVFNETATYKHEFWLKRVYGVCIALQHHIDANITPAFEQLMSDMDDNNIEVSEFYTKTKDYRQRIKRAFEIDKEDRLTYLGASIKMNFVPTRFLHLQYVSELSSKLNIKPHVEVFENPNTQKVHFNLDKALRKIKFDAKAMPVKPKNYQENRATKSDFTIIYINKEIIEGLFGVKFDGIRSGYYELPYGVRVIDFLNTLDESFKFYYNESFIPAKQTIGFDCEFRSDTSHLLSFQFYNVQWGIGLITFYTGKKPSLKSTIAGMVANFKPKILDMVAHYNIAEMSHFDRFTHDLTAIFTKDIVEEHNANNTDKIENTRDNIKAKRNIGANNVLYTSSNCISSTRYINFKHKFRMPSPESDKKFINNVEVKCKLAIKDTYLQSNKQSLDNLGKMLNFTKEDLEKHEIENMDDLLHTNPMKYIKYSLKDSIITGLATIKLDENVIDSGFLNPRDNTHLIPAASTLAGNYFGEQLDKFGREKLGMANFSRYHQGWLRANQETENGTKKVWQLRPDLNEGALSYYGGRNECFFHGLTTEQVLDFDIKSAYPSAMLSLYSMDYGKTIIKSRPAYINKLNQDDYLKYPNLTSNNKELLDFIESLPINAMGYVCLRYYKFNKEVQYPVFPQKSKNSLVFTGSYNYSHKKDLLRHAELSLIINKSAKEEIEYSNLSNTISKEKFFSRKKQEAGLEGSFYYIDLISFLHAYKEAGLEEFALEKIVFYPPLKDEEGNILNLLGKAQVRVLNERAEAKKDKDKLKELMCKNVSNYGYGKITQGISGKRKFNIGDYLGYEEHVSTMHKAYNPTSALFNPVMAACITGMVRCAVSEAMETMYAKGFKSASVTTDGFAILGDAKIEDLNDNLGALNSFIKQTRLEYLNDDSPLYEIKHTSPKGEEYISIQTRFYWQVIHKDIPEAIIAKGGIQCPTKDKVEQTAFLKNAYLNPLDQVEMKRLISLRELVLDPDEIFRSITTKIEKSFDFDLKRKPIEPKETIAENNGKSYKKVSFHTKPYSSEEEYVNYKSAYHIYGSRKRNKLQSVEAVEDISIIADNLYFFLAHKDARGITTLRNFFIQAITDSIIHDFKEEGLNPAKDLKSFDIQRIYKDLGRLSHITSISEHLNIAKEARNYTLLSKDYLENIASKSTSIRKWLDLVKSRTYPITIKDITIKYSGQELIDKLYTPYQHKPTQHNQDITSSYTY